MLRSFLLTLALTTIATAQTNTTPEPKVKVPFQVECSNPDGQRFCIRLDTRTGHLWLIKFGVVEEASGMIDKAIWEKQLNSVSLAAGTVLGQFVAVAAPTTTPEGWILLDQIEGHTWLIHELTPFVPPYFSFSQIKDQ